MNDAKLTIARKLIEVLANESCNTVGSGAEQGDKGGVRRIVEAARVLYVLPSYCAEMNDTAAKCIDCIIDHDPPAICRSKIDDEDVGEPDVGWDED